jgi:L-ascorbate metabolism protein UlaG (beta-lactamase superfamily)
MLAMVAAVTMWAATSDRVQAQRSSALATEPACQTLNLASTGGPLPKSRNVVILRYLGSANHELVFRDNIFLLDAHYDRAGHARQLGFNFKDMQKASAIFIGHAHSDHVSDAVPVALQTGARVFGGPPTYDFVRANGLPEKQAVQVRGGETFEFNGVNVAAVLAHHSDRPGAPFQKATQGFRDIQGALQRPRTEEEQQHQQAIGARGSPDPRLATEGTIAYLFTFSNGYRLYYQDSAGPITEPQKELVKTIGAVDLGLFAYQGFFLSQNQIDATMPLVRLFKPRVLLPTHHDESGGGFGDMATEPLFMAVRDELPGTQTVSPLYRTPVCIDIATKEVYVGR